MITKEGKRKRVSGEGGGGSVSNASYRQTRMNNSSRQSRAIGSVSRRENCPFVLKETLFSGDPNTKRCPSAWQVPTINEKQQCSRATVLYHISTRKKKQNQKYWCVSVKMATSQPGHNLKRWTDNWRALCLLPSQPWPVSCGHQPLFTALRAALQKDCYIHIKGRFWSNSTWPYLSLIFSVCDNRTVSFCRSVCPCVTTAAYNWSRGSHHVLVI